MDERHVVWFWEERRGWVDLPPSDDKLAAERWATTMRQASTQFSKSGAVRVLPIGQTPDPADVPK